MIPDSLSTVNRIFNSESEFEDSVPKYQKKVSQMYGTDKNEYNPFLDKNGNIFNKYINYQMVLDNPNVTAKAKEFITKATGLTPSPIKSQSASNYEAYTKSSGINTSFNANADENNLASLDVTTELPKLDANQISKIISQYFSKSNVIKPSDAQGIYNAQQKSGMSALAILGIGALESGYGTSSIANAKNNIWGWNATNKNPSGNATKFSEMSNGALEFADAYMKTYYNGYGAKSIMSAGTGNNPSGKGYAYYDNGKINSSWATSIGSIMKNFYQTAKSVSQNKTQQSNTKSTDNTGSIKTGVKVANTKNYNNNAAYGQCVWYVRGRMKEKTGKDFGALGNANEVWYNAPKNSKLPASYESIKPNTVASYKTGSSGSKYGHVIYIEAVDGDNVYYTEGGSGYHKNGTDGILKRTTKKDILNGTGGYGSGLIGLIDISKI